MVLLSVKPVKVDFELSEKHTILIPSARILLLNVPCRRTREDHKDHRESGQKCPEALSIAGRPAERDER